MRVLIGEIASGKYAEGELLPRESDVAEQFDVSRGVARECLRGLEERGLVKVRHGRGAIVTADDRWDRFDPDVLAALLRSHGGAAVLGEYLEGRRIVEVEAAGLAAERATAAAVEDLRLAFRRMCATAEQARVNPAAEQRYHDADVAFHRAVVRAAANPVLGLMTEPIHRALSASFDALARPRARFERGLPEHERILCAIAARHPAEAREAMRAHLMTVEGYLSEYDRRPARPAEV
jgi:GntR family transcriptional repressor for pyruvate dehydrogenase complex